MRFKGCGQLEPQSFRRPTSPAYRLQTATVSPIENYVLELIQNNDSNIEVFRTC